jgi:hypothetical protein
MPVTWHVDDPELLREAIRFTAASTGFQPALVEKDYFASVVLEWLALRNPELAFKGGTALSKIHSGFFRLSEDLDFSIEPPDPSTARARSGAAAGLKQSVGRNQPAPGRVQGRQSDPWIEPVASIQVMTGDWQGTIPDDAARLLDLIPCCHPE